MEKRLRKVMLKNGKPHPELECEVCNSPIEYKLEIVMWVCSVCSWAAHA